MYTMEAVGYVATPILLVLLIVAIVEIVKGITKHTRFLPLVDVGLGMTGGALVYGLGLGYDIVVGLLIGAVLGMFTCGLFSFAKNLAGASFYVTTDKKGKKHSFYAEKDMEWEEEEPVESEPEWNSTITCSKCGEPAPYVLENGKYVQKDWHYCPHCGAAMKGDKTK